MNGICNISAKSSITLPLPLMADGLHMYVCMFRNYVVPSSIGSKSKAIQSEKNKQPARNKISNQSEKISNQSEQNKQLVRKNKQPVITT